MNACADPISEATPGFSALPPPTPVRLRRVLVPLDFSASSLSAYHYAMALAECFGGELILLHIIPPSVLPEWGYAHLARRDGRLRTVAHQKLTEFVRRQGLAGQRVTNLLVSAGEPPLQIPEVARAQGVDLVVMATHGDSLVPHCLLSNTAEEVVRRAPCPVWVVPGVTDREAAQPPTMLPLRRILVATDFSAEAGKALDYGIALAREFEAALHLVHVVPTVLPADVSHLTTLMQETELKNSAHRDLARLCAEQVPPSLGATTAVLDGNPFLEISKEALRVCAGLIIVSTHGYTGLRYLLLGSTAQHVVQHASVPVLVVREHEPEFVPVGDSRKECS